ncbi:MAG: TIGR00730 family Rossman fold protein [Candidatus Omnitrophica bacterium]|nr:TIGR00730 family Rossman fold protein [Candidatus Omnitrophota bacterium]MCM8791281.1 TIGR00730 family Rossman fold protein [Candidatus Omnitrophota bacterium]
MGGKKEYRIGDEDIEGLIEALAALSSSPETSRLLEEILTTVVKLGMESKDIGDLKLINNAMKELRYSFKVFAPYRDVRKVVIFGSARSKPSAAEYKMAEKFARKLSDSGYMVVTGGGGGIMEAGNKGTGPGGQFALNIRLPFEQKPNPYINEKEKLINFKYFFTRKLIFIKETDATALFPGGFGTHDEGFEILTLVQTGKSRPRPIVLLEPSGMGYWSSWKRFISGQLVNNGYIDAQDLKLYRITTDVDEAVRYIQDFYRVYHSIRYIGNLTVLRLNRELSPGKIADLNRRFSDILTGGEIRPSQALNAEVSKGEFVGLPRLVMKFNRRDYGRLYELISSINGD